LHRADRQSYVVALRIIETEHVVTRIKLPPLVNGIEWRFAGLRPIGSPSELAAARDSRGAAISADFRRVQARLPGGSFQRKINGSSGLIHVRSKTVLGP
jgi:hypothetical protein